MWKTLVKPLLLYNHCTFEFKFVVSTQPLLLIRRISLQYKYLLDDFDYTIYMTQRFALYSTFGIMLLICFNLCVPWHQLQKVAVVCRYTLSLEGLEFELVTTTYIHNIIVYSVVQCAES